MRMYPAYGGMSSYPYQRPQMASPQYYLPSWEAAPPQVKEDPAAARPSFTYGSWPQNYGYPVPMQCPSCCNHAQHPPAYHNFRPPCAHFQCPPPAYGGHFCGGYPLHPVGYVPPPHYTTELPRYEYDKNAPREFHCCGCHNHPCHVKEDKHVKIEEHDPEVENRTSESLVPAGANNFPQPILWIPPGYAMKQNRQQQQLPRRVVENEADNQQISPYYVENPQWQRRPIKTEVEEQQESPRVKNLQWQRRPAESEAGEHVESPRVKKPQQSVKTVEQEPNVRYGWFPLDVNSIKELLEGGQGKKACERESKGGDGKNIQAIESKEQNKQFPVPIFWMPYGGQGENEVTGQQEKDAGETPGKEASPTFKIIPMRFEYPASEPEKIKTAVGDDDRGVGSQATEKTSTIKTIPVKPCEESVPKQLKKDGPKPVKNAEGNVNNGQSSSPKKSKLPPICLRVDPPKKKNGNCSSRSPSPPKKQQDSVESKTGGNKKEIKVAEADDKVSSQCEIEVSCKAAEQKMEKQETDVAKGVGEHQSQEAKESKSQEAEKLARKILSEQDAATVIQSAYRGYDVRRWELLKKLRHIAKVHEEAGEIRKHIEDLESRTGSSTDEKEKATLAETIMKLLLKLDTVQGLPPSFRDVRRSVAKELVILQEKLDSIINKNSAPMAPEICTAEEPSKISSQGEGSQGIAEPAEEPSNLFGQPEGSEVVETVQEPSNISGLDESSRDVGETAEESSMLSSEMESFEAEDRSIQACLDESSRDAGETAADSSKIPSEIEICEGEDKSAHACIKDEGEVPKLNEVCSAQPLTSQEVVSGSEDEKTIETSPVKSGPQDEIASSPPEPTESADQPASIGENATVWVGELFGDKDEQVNVTAELPEKLEDKKEISDVEVNSGVVLGEESVECAHSAVDTVDAKIDESTQHAELPQEVADEGVKEQKYAELPQEVADEGVKEQTSDIQCSETLSRDAEDQSADVMDEAAPPIEPGSRRSKSTNSISIEIQKVQEPEPVDVGIPIVEQDVHGPEKSVAEGGAPLEAGSQESHVDGVRLDSTMASDETQVSPDEEACQSVRTDQEKTLKETDSVLDRQTVPGCEDLKDQSIRSEPAAAEIVTQESKHKEGGAKESKEGHEEEQIDKRVVEENEKLREMLERLIASEKQQQDLISSLSGKVKDLEKQLARKRKMRSSKRPRVLVSRASCGSGKPSNGSSLRGRLMGVAS